MDHHIIYAMLLVIREAIKSLPLVLAELRRLRRPPGSK